MSAHNYDWGFSRDEGALSLSAIDLIETLKDLLVRNQKKQKILIALCSMEYY